MATAATLRSACSRNRWAIAAVTAAAVAILPFVRGLLAGRVLYFRDLSILFHPFRRYALEGLLQGQVWFWDPFVHEGVPLLYLPLAYPLDLLQLLRPDERGISIVLALHVPLAAAAFTILARRLDLSPIAAAGGGIVYALSGFTLSTLNLYVYVQAVAWAPLLLAALLAAAEHGGRAVCAAALVAGVIFSTTAAEVALQAVIAGLVASMDVRRPKSVLRGLAAVALGAALAAPLILVMSANMAAGERARGFSVDVVLNQSVHPFTLLQVVIAALYGDLARGPNQWWGSNFFDRGFPYMLSLYLGGTVLALALTGATSGGRRARVWIALGTAGLVVALGRWGGLGTIVGALPESWRVIRYPTKAFFTVTLAIAVLAAMGLEAVQRSPPARRRLGIALAAIGLPLVLLPVAPVVFEGATGWFVSHFFPPALSASTRWTYLGAMLRDAAGGGAIAIAGAIVALLAYRNRIRPALATMLLAATTASDLLRAGAGLNPMMEARRFATSPEVLAAVRAAGVRRAFTCDVESSHSYWEARRSRPQDHEMLTFFAARDTLTPHYNRSAHVESALSLDLTALVPASRLLPPGAGCASPAALLPWLRRAGVTHVVSLDAMDVPGLLPAGEAAPPRIAPLRVRLYAVQATPPLRYVAHNVRRGAPPADAVPDPAGVTWIDAAPAEVSGAEGTIRPLREEPGVLEYQVEASQPTALVILDGWFPGWQATVEGRVTPVLAAGKHRAVWVPAGTSRVTLEYRQRGLRPGLVLSFTSAALLALIAWGGPRRTRGLPTSSLP